MNESLVCLDYSNNCCRRQHTILHQSVSCSRIICSREVDFGMFVRTYGFRFMTFFDVTEILKNITYSRSRFNFPNTLVATREQHRGPWQFLMLYSWTQLYNFYLHKTCLQLLILHVARTCWMTISYEICRTRTPVQAKTTASHRWSHERMMTKIFASVILRK